MRRKGQGIGYGYRGRKEKRKYKEKRPEGDSLPASFIRVILCLSPLALCLQLRYFLLHQAAVDGRVPDDLVGQGPEALVLGLDDLGEPGLR